MGFNGTDGVNGTQGPQGPAGISKINGSNYYSLPGPIGPIPLSASMTASSTISCNEGDFALSGEYQLFSLIAGYPTVFLFGSLNHPPTGWTTTIVGEPGQAVQTLVNCFDNSP